MKARKGEAVEAAVGILIGLVAGIMLGGALKGMTYRTVIVKAGYFQRANRVYKVTEYSKLEYPQKGTENEETN